MAARHRRAKDGKFVTSTRFPVRHGVIKRNALEFQRFPVQEDQQGGCIVEVLNAFIGKKDRPSAEEVSAALGPALNLWNEFIVWMAEKHGVAAQEWKGVCVNKYGWTLRLLLKKRTIVYLSPCQGCFRAALVLGDRAVAAAKAAKTSKKVLQALAEATRYPEGTGLRLTIKKPADLAAIRLLAAIKLAN